MNQPSDQLTSSPPEPSRRIGRVENLVPGVKPSQERDARGVLRTKKPPLGTEKEPDLAAMEWVVTHAEDRTHQHAYFRRLLEKEPKWFAERLAELQDAGQVRHSDTPGREWDGTGACPTCHRGPAEVSEPEPVEKLIEEMLNRIDDGD